MKSSPIMESSRTLGKLLHTKYHGGLILSILRDYYSIYIKNYSSPKHKWDITLRQLNTDGKTCPTLRV